MELTDRTFESNNSFTSTARSNNRRPHSREINVHNVERIVSAFGGGLLAILGLTKGGRGGLGLALLGSGLAWRGLSGHCDVYGALGINTARHKHAGVRHGEGIKVEKSVTINKAPSELYRFWRNFENLPRFMNHLEAVRVLDDKHSHWKAKAPLGTRAEWDAEIINEQANELIAWRSVEGSSVPNAGSVRFEQEPGTTETVVRVSLNYAPPGGKFGALLAKLFGEEPEQQVAEDLRRFKQLMETGETASTQGQPSGQAASGARSGR